MPRHELSGSRFGKWVVLSYAGPSPNKAKSAMWSCICDCGTESIVFGFALRNGSSTSCGCSVSERNRAYKAKQNIAGQSRHRLYNTWGHMRDRCLNPSSDSWHNYGGRGIKICPEWESPLAFIEWAQSAGYRPGLTLDRIDNDLGYSSDNCRWATAKEQHENKRTNLLIKIDGEVKCFKSWADHFGVNHSTAKARFRKGKPIFEVFGYEASLPSR